MDSYVWPRWPRVDSAATSKINARYRADERAQGRILGGNVRKTARRNTQATGSLQAVAESAERSTGAGT